MSKGKEEILADVDFCDKGICDHCGCEDCLPKPEDDTTCVICERLQFEEARLALAQNKPGCPRDYQTDWLSELIGTPLPICIPCYEHIYWTFINSTAKRGRGVVSDELRERILIRDNRCCRYCGTKKNLQIDHIFPVIRGGPTEEWNLLTACRRCNLKKRARTPGEAGMVIGEV